MYAAFQYEKTVHSQHTAVCKFQSLTLASSVVTLCHAWPRDELASLSCKETMHSQLPVRAQSD